MSFVSTGFVFFCALVAVAYYLVPKKIKWIVLLFASYVFYALNNVKAIIFIFLSTLVSYLSAVNISKISDTYDGKLETIDDKTERKNLKKECKSKKKLIAGLGLSFCFGILIIAKYTNFFISNINNFIPEHAKLPALKIILPLGISFYTFQIASYIFDVYNGKYKAEKNFFHYALYVSWFPALLQGPISRYNELKKQFFEEDHRFDITSCQYALQRILWGFLKKLVIADRAAEVVTYIFAEHAKLPWYITFIGLVFYSIKLYADFSGGMDVVIGVSELVGIKLSENFRQPFFSQSISEFWRRWHITLGTWMKDYIFYPFSLSKFASNMGKSISKVNKYAGKIVPMCIANLLVFFVVGIWHGAEWHFIVYGLYNGFLIVLGIVFKPVSEKIIDIFHIDVKNKWYKIFRILRTFLLINIGWVFDEVNDLGQSLSMLKQLFRFNTANLISNWKFDTFSELTIYTVILFCLIWFITSVLKEKNVDIRKKIGSLALPIRWIIYLALILSVPFFQAANMAGFIYAQF